MGDVCNLFDRWERVWHEGQYDLIAGCVQPNYIRHDEAGDRTVTRDAYAAEIATARQDRPNNRFVVYDHEITADRAGFRFTLMWNDAATREPRTRAGLQVYRIEDGKLAETWLTLLKLGWHGPIRLGRSTGRASARDRLLRQAADFWGKTDF
jgi:hypothetical protein